MSGQVLPEGPLSDAIIVAVSRLVDDAQSETREPSHSGLEFQIQRTGLIRGDPKAQGHNVGKAKRVRSVLSWALENNVQGGRRFVASLISFIRGCGGFRETSTNFVGVEAMRDATDAFRAEGYELASDGSLRPLLLDNLSGTALTEALDAYVRRAKRGASDAALVTGTGKDLLEAVATHVLQERWSSVPPGSNFPMLLGQAFVALELATLPETKQPGEPVQRRLERALYEAGCAVNQLRNKEGTGHGRPWLPSISDFEARTAIELMGVISEYILAQHRRKQ